MTKKTQCVGQFAHVARLDPLAPPGRMRLLLKDVEQARAVRAAVHGQSVMVGLDRVGLRVVCDAHDIGGLPGHRPG